MHMFISTVTTKMNTIVLVSVALAFLHLASSKKLVPDVASILVDNSSNCKGVGLQCKNCEELHYCSSSLHSVFSVNCTSTNAATPYCDPGTNSCTSEQPATCSLGESDYLCPGQGYYPDLLDCQQFMQCDAELVAHRRACGKGTRYDHNLQACTPDAQCLSYDSTEGLCAGKFNNFVAYPPSPNLYVLCAFRRAPVVLQCPHEGDIFDECDQKCDFQCVRNGFFPYAKDPTKFYACTKIGENFVKSLLHCIPGTKFVTSGIDSGVCLAEAPPAVETTTMFSEKTTTTFADETTATLVVETTTTSNKKSTTPLTEVNDFLYNGINHNGNDELTNEEEQTIPESLWTYFSNAGEVENNEDAEEEASNNAREEGPEHSDDKVADEENSAFEDQLNNEGSHGDGQGSRQQDGSSGKEQSREDDIASSQGGNQEQEQQGEEHEQHAQPSSGSSEQHEPQIQDNQAQQNDENQEHHAEVEHNHDAFGENKLEINNEI